VATDPLHVSTTSRYGKDHRSMTSESRLRLRRATLDDVPVLERWDTDPDVIAATTDDDATERAFGGFDWREEPARTRT
jgi:hypothetical protein